MPGELNEKKIQEMIDDSIRRAMEFSTRKRGDTPTDADQLVPMKYCDTNTKPIASLFGAKGDILVGTAPSVFTNLAVGTNGQYLMADSGQSTGVQWASVTAGIQSILGSGVTSSVTAANTVTISTKYPYYAQENGNYTSTDVSPHKTFTYTDVGFDPRMIQMGIILDDSASISAPYFSNLLVIGGPNYMQFPCVWINDSYKIGYYNNQNTAPQTWEDYTSALMRLQSGTGKDYIMEVQAHSASSLTLRIFRQAGSGSETIAYRFWFIAFP